MALSAGTRLGPYEVVALIGAGGMGEVYKASVTPDGQRFLVPQYVVPTNVASGPIGPDTPSGLTLALNWTRSLKK